MTRRFWLLPSSALIVPLLLSSLGASAAEAGIIPETTAAQHGLSRAWFTQVQVDQARGRVQYLVLHSGLLLAATDRAMLHALDAETGQTLWVAQVGRPEHPTLIPAANKYLVAVVNGSYLFVLNRKTGKLLWKTQLEDAPGAGPVLSDQRGYVPMVSGLMHSYRLQPTEDPMKELGKIGGKKMTAEEKKAAESDWQETLRLKQEVVLPLACKSWGRAMVQPIVLRQNESEEYVAWPTDRGLLFVGGINRLESDQFTVKYQMGIGSAAASPCYLPPDPKVTGDSGLIFVTSSDGFVYAVREKDGSLFWRFSAGEPLVEQAVVVEPHVYATTQFGGMYCLSVDKGAQLWWTPRAARFVAASKTRVYAADKLGQMLVIDARNGSRLDTLVTQDLPLKLVNIENDRIYMGSETGLVQCLRETALEQPVLHNAQRLYPVEKKATQQTSVDDMQKAQEGEGAVDAADPFAAPDAEAAPAKPVRKPSGGRPARKPRAAEEDEEGGGLADAIGEEDEEEEK